MELLNILACRKAIPRLIKEKMDLATVNNISKQFPELFCQQMDFIALNCVNNHLKIIMFSVKFEKNIFSLLNRHT